MRILIVTQIFSPEMGAQSNRLYPIARHLAAAGHEVYVATGMPNYPQGVVFPQYRGKRFLREEVDGFTILRTACYTTPRNKGRWSQLLSYLSFIPAALHSGLRAGKVDVVFVTSPPIFSAIPAVYLGKLQRARLVFDVRDLWPDEIIACGAGRRGSIPVRIIESVERWIYRSADRVCCTTRSFIETVVERGVGRDRVMLLPNGADLDLFRPLPRNNHIAGKYDLGDRFVVMYSGVLGIKHGLEVILEAARLLNDKREIVFLLLGNGARRQALVEQAKKMGLQNVIFAGERNVKEIPALLARADLCVSALLPDPYLEKIITVKVFEYMACAKPVVGALAGETARVLQDSGGGLVVPANEPAAMAEAIMALYNDPERRIEMGEAGRRFVEQYYSRRVWAARLEEMLKSLCEKRQPEKARGRVNEEGYLESHVR